MQTNNQQSCLEHQHCIHQHYQKCKKQRERSIAYTTFPDDKLNILSNVHKKCTNQFCYNFSTLAYQKFALGKQPQTQVDRNFIKNYYLQNVPQQMQMTNQIIKQLQNETYPFNAYNMAENATKQYKAFEFKRQQYLITAQRRAKNNTKAFFKTLNQQKSTEHAQNSKWIRKIIMAMEQMGQKMFGLVVSGKQNKDTSNNEGSERMFLNEKKHVDGKFLSSCKITDTKTSKQIFQDVRAQMLKNKKKFDQQRLNNRNNTFNASLASENSTLPPGEQKSMIASVSAFQGQQESQSQLIEKLCDFDKLKKKWKAQDVQNVKDMIVRYLTKKIILNCEQERSKQQRHAQKAGSTKINKSPIKVKARKQYFSQQKIGTNQKKNPKSQSLNKIVSTLQTKPIFKQKLTKQQHQTKAAIVKGGQFDIMGLKYERNRNYSNMFKKKGDNHNLNLSLNYIISDQKNSNRVIFKCNHFQEAIQMQKALLSSCRQHLASTSRDTNLQRQTERASSLPKGSRTARTRCI